MEDVILFQDIEAMFFNGLEYDVEVEVEMLVGPAEYIVTGYHVFSIYELTRSGDRKEVEITDLADEFIHMVGVEVDQVAERAHDTYADLKGW